MANAYAFEPARVKYGDQFVRGFTTICARCGAKGEVPCNTFRSHGADDHIVAALVARRFREQGWSIGGGRRNHCPGCKREIERVQAAERMRRKRALDAARKDATVGENDMAQQQNTVVPLKTEPREATPEERRIISAKLDDVYDVKAGRYIAPWTDQAVATDLGVPRAWVSHVRALLYGEEASNPEIEAVLAEARDVLDRVKESSGKVAAAASQLAALKEDHAKLVTRAEMIERKIASIEKALH